MAKVKITGHASGSGVFTITAPNSNTDRTITLPDASVTLGTDATKLPLAGGTLTGNLDVTMTSVGDGVDLIDTNTAHGMTDYLPTNASLRLSQNNATEGGGLIIGATDNTGQHGLSFYGLCPDNAVSTVDNFRFVAGEQSGTGIDTVAGSKKVLTVDNNTTELFTILGNGRGLSQFTAKAWCQFKMSDTAAFTDSHNFGGFTDVGTGAFSLAYTAGLTGAGASVVGAGNDDHIVGHSNIASDSFRGYAYNTGNTNVDIGHACFLVFGD